MKENTVLKCEGAITIMSESLKQYYDTPKRKLKLEVSKFYLSFTNRYGETSALIRFLVGIEWQCQDEGLIVSTYRKLACTHSLMYI